MKCVVTLSLIAMSLLFQSMALAVTIKDVVYETKNAGKVVFSHRSHLQRKGLTNNCRACHDAIFDLKVKKQYAMVDMYKGKSCGTCHDGGKAFALRECATCHLTKEIIFKVKATGPTVFSHKLHLAKSADCGLCHPSIFATRGNKHFTMEDMAAGKSCGSCHDGKKASALDRCANCHPFKEITYKVKETGPTQFSHNIHVEVTGCGKCHPKLYTPDRHNKRVAMAAMEKGKSCGACHNAKEAFSVKECSKCHPVRELIFEEKNAGNVIFSHKKHTVLYTCADCHDSLFQPSRSKAKVPMQMMEKGRSCGTCHDGKTAFSVKDKCDSCHKI